MGQVNPAPRMSYLRRFGLLFVFLLALIVICSFTIWGNIFTRPNTIVSVTQAIILPTATSPRQSNIYFPGVFTSAETPTPLPTVPVFITTCDILRERISPQSEIPQLTYESLWVVVCHEKNVFPDGRTGLIFKRFDTVEYIIGHCEEPLDEIPPDGTIYKIDEFGYLQPPIGLEGYQTFSPWQKY